MVKTLFVSFKLKAEKDEPSMATLNLHTRGEALFADSDLGGSNRLKDG